MNLLDEKKIKLHKTSLPRSGHRVDADKNVTGISLHIFPIVQQNHFTDTLYI